MNKRIFALFLTFCLMIGAVPVYAGAATGQQVSADAVSVTAGNGVTLTLNAANLQNVAALDVNVYYDPSVLTVSYTSNGSMLSGAQASVNTGVSGEIKLSLMALNGISGSGSLLSVRFTTQSDCAPGTYPVTVAVGRAYNGSLEPVEVKGVNGSVTVNKPVPTEKFTLYSYPDKSTLQNGDTLSVRLANGGSRKMVSGEFFFSYDPEVFAFEALTMERDMIKGDAVYSVNSAALGQVRVAYASDTPVSCFYMMTLTLRVIANTEGTTVVTADATNMYREDLSLYLPGNTYNSFTLVKTTEETDHPDVYFETEDLIVGNTAASVLYLEAGADVAAADFTLTYDPAVLSCKGVEDLAEAMGGMLVVNDNYKEGTVRFSYINQTPPAESVALMKLLWEPLTAEHYTLTALAEGAVDVKYTPVLLDHPEATGCIYMEERREPTCEADGVITYTCSCGKTLPEVVLPTEHPWGEGVYTAPTYESDGFTTFTCQSCGRSKVEKQDGTMLQPAQIFRHPEAITVESGETAVFSVEAANTAVSYKWEYQKLYKWFDTALTGYDTDTLIVPATGYRNTYRYRCTVTFADGTVLVSRPAELTVNTYITGVQNPNNQTVVLGYKGQFTAAAKGEALTYQWQYCRPGTSKWIDTAMEGAKKPTVYIETTVARDGYRYRCKITDVTGKTVFTEPATMRVLSFTNHPKSVLTTAGKTVQFAVTTSVEDGFSYRWQYSRNGGASWMDTSMPGHDTNTLTVAATIARNGYQYRCVVTGSQRSTLASKAATLQVVEPVKITAQPVSVTVTAAETAVFTVVAENVASYRWQYSRNGISWYDTGADGCKTAVLTVPVKGKNGYRYRCCLKGLDGVEVITEFATLTVQ